MSNQSLILSREDLPPPYAYRLHLDWAEDVNLIKVKISYPGANQLKEEEWVEAGLNPTFDWAWSGSLPQVWQEELKDWKNWKLETKQQVTAAHHLNWGAELPTGYLPFDQKKEERIQSFIQAIRELAGAEDPMQLLIRYKGVMYLLEAVFAEKRLVLSLKDQSTKPLPWNHLSQLMSLIAMPESDLIVTQNKQQPAFSWDGLQFFFLPEKALRLLEI